MRTPPLARAVALGLAAGSRTTLGAAAPVLAGSARPAVRALAGLAVVGELVGDKLPVTPSRLEGPAPVARAASGALGAAVVARRRHAGPAGTVLAAACSGAAALVGTGFGAAWRAAVGRHRPDWHGALVEDVVALGLAAWAAGPRAGRRPAQWRTTVTGQLA